MITTKMETITPAKAAEWLNHFNPNNRKLSPRYANRLAKIMTADRWVANGVPFIFDENGNLVDGQHRLRGVVVSGKTITGLVVRGVSDHAFETVDCNRTRSVGDVYGIKGIPSANTVAATVKAILIIQREGCLTHTDTPKKPIRYEVIEYIEALDKERLYASVRQAGRIRVNLGGSPAVLGACRYLSPKLDVADDFWEQLETGIDVKKGTPVALLRNYILINTRGTHTWRDVSQYLVYVKCLNATIEGKPMARLLIQPGEVPQTIYQIKTRR